MSLYRKYRPQTFSNLVGQDHINRTLLNALKLGRVNHAYLYTGPRGTGKTSTARLMAKAINCLELKDSEPCNKCEICTDINEGKLIDLIEIDAASNRGIDEIRELKEKINFSPTRAKTKVYIIDEVHMLTKEAFNALLKTLEEPPDHVYFILATTEAHKIPETILSRCQRFDFKRISEQVLIDRLKFVADSEKISADEKALELIAHHCEGGMRDAIGLLEQLSVDGALKYEHVCNILGVSGIASIENLYGFLVAGDMKGALAEIDSLYMDGFDLVYFNKRFLEYLRKKMIGAVESGVGGDFGGGAGNVRSVGSVGSAASLPWLLDTISFFERAYEQSKSTLIPQLPLETACVKSVLKGTSVSLFGSSVPSASVGSSQVGTISSAHGETVGVKASVVGSASGLCNGLPVSSRHAAPSDSDASFRSTDAASVGAGSDATTHPAPANGADSKVGSIGAVSSAPVAGTKTNEMNTPQMSDASSTAVNVAEPSSPLPERAHKSIKPTAVNTTSRVDLPIGANKLSELNSSSEVGKSPEVDKSSDAVSAPTTETQKKNSEVQKLELAMFQESWNEILELVKTPVVKRTLMNGRPYKVEGNKLVVAFSNMFNINKMSSPESLDEIEKAIESKLGIHAKVSGEVNTDVVRPMPKKQDESEAEKLLEAKAMDIFGGMG